MVQMLKNTDSISNKGLVYELNKVKTRLNSSKEVDKEYYALFAKIEFLHNKYLSHINN